MPRPPGKTNWDRLCQFTLSADDLGCLLGVSDQAIYDHLVDGSGRKVVWSDDDRPDDVFLDWAGQRIPVRQSHGGAVMFLTREVDAVLAGNRRLHPSVR